MDSKLQDFKLPPSMRSDHGEPSAPKKRKSLTLFEDLLEYPDVEKSHSGVNLEPQPEKDSSPSDYQNGPYATHNKSLTLFADLLENPDTEELHGANLEAHDENDSRPSNYQNRAYAINEEKSWPSLSFNRMSDDNIVYQRIKGNLVSSFNSGGIDVQVETIYRNSHSSTMGRPKFQTFGIYKMAIEENRGGNANVICAWYGASKNEINGILSYGFSLPLNSGVYGRGFYFSAARHPLQSLQFSTIDGDGLRHMLLCRVILGRVEVITPGSGQHNPSSEEFDNGVDRLVHPRKFIIWNAKVNTHVLPEFIVGFRTSPSCGFQRIFQNIVPPNSDWIPVASLINGLSNFIPGSARKLLAKYLSDHEKHKITRQVLIQRIRLIVGDRLLRTMIISFGEKVKASKSSTQAPKRSEEADYPRMSE